MNNLSIFHHLKKFNLDDNQIEIYLGLYQLKVATVVQLSKHTNINRTTAYRVLDQLEQIGLVKQIVGHKTTKYEACSAELLELTIIKEEEKITELRQSLAHIITATTTLAPSSIHPTQVLYFQGKEGLKQLLWNTLQAGKNGEIVGFGYTNLNTGVGKFFAEKIRKEYINHGITKREILNIDQLEFEEDYTDFASEYRVIYEGRGIDSSKIEIKHDTMIYNNVIAFYHQFNGELFGVEIHNAEIVKTQKQIFELLWQMAQTKKEVLGGY